MSDYYFNWKCNHLYFALFIVPTILFSCTPSSTSNPTAFSDASTPTITRTILPTIDQTPSLAFTLTSATTSTPTPSPTAIFNFSSITITNLSKIHLIEDSVLVHRGYVYGADWSPDNKVIAVTTDTGIHLFNADNGYKIGIINTIQPAYAIAFSPNGQELAYGDGHSLLIYDIASQKILSTLYGQTNTIRCIKYSPDGNLLATGGDDNNVIVWNVEEKQQQYLLRGHTGEVLGVAFDPNSANLASASMDGSIIIWRLNDGMNIQQIPADEYGVHAIAYIHNGDWVIAGGEEGLIKVWDAKTGNLLNQEESHTGMVLTLTADKEANTIAWAGLDGTIYIQSATDFSDYRTIIAHNGYVHQIGINREGSKIVSVGSDYSAYVWDVLTTNELFPLIRGFFNPVTEIYNPTYSPNGNYLLLFGLYSNELYIWDPSRDMLKMVYRGEISDAFVNNDGIIAITHSLHEPVSLFDIKSNSIAYYKPSGEGYCGKGFGHITGSYSGKYLAWSWILHQEICNQPSITPNPYNIYHVSIGGTGDEAKVYEIPLSQNDFPSSRCINDITMGFNPAIESEIMISTPKRLILFDVENGKDTSIESNSVKSLVFSPDGSMVVTSMMASACGESRPINRLTIWKINDDRSITRVSSIPGSDMSFSPDGKIMAIVDNGEIHLLNIDDWSNLRSLSVPGETMTEVIFDPAGYNIISISKKGNVYLWGINA